MPAGYEGKTGGRSCVMEIGVLILISVAVAFGYNALSPRGIALVGEWDTTLGVVSAGAKDRPVVHDIEIQDISEAKALFDSGKVLFVDARAPERFAEGHIRGAILLPIGSVDDQIESFMSQYADTTPIITYCSGRECEDSHHLARFLLSAGYGNVRVFIDGFPEWAKKGYPVEEGSK